MTVGSGEATFEQAYPPIEAPGVRGTNIRPAGKFNRGARQMVGEMFYGHDAWPPTSTPLRVFDSTGFLTGSGAESRPAGSSSQGTKVSVLNNSGVAALHSPMRRILIRSRLDWMIIGTTCGRQQVGEPVPACTFQKVDGHQFTTACPLESSDSTGSSDGPITSYARGHSCYPICVVPVTTTSAAAGASRARQR